MKNEGQVNKSSEFSGPTKEVKRVRFLSLKMFGGGGRGGLRRRRK